MIALPPPADGAAWLHQQGFVVFPLVRDQKIPAKEGWQNWRGTVDAIRACQARFNWGINLGATGHFAIDVDMKKCDGEATLRALEAELGPLPPTLTQYTPTGGRHLIYKGVVPNSVNRLGDGVDIRGVGGYIVAAGSIIGGKAYTINQAEQREAPTLWVARARLGRPERVETPDVAEPDKDEHIAAAAEYLMTAEPCVEGHGGDDRLYRVCCHVRDLGVTEATALELIEEHFNDRCSPPWGTEELERKVENAYQYAQNSFGAKTPEVKRALAQQEFTVVPIEPSQEVIDKPSHLLELLDARRFNLSAPPPPARPIYRIGKATIATPGNLLVIAAQAKAGKSALVGAFIAAATGSEGDTLGILSENPLGHALIHFDTEQSPADHHGLVATALRRVNADSQPAWLRSYRLADVSMQQRMGMLVLELERARRDHGGIHSVLLDGVADFIADPNDSTESFSLVEKLHQLAVTYDTNIGCVLHFNPGNDFNKTRGHLGSQLERKAETNLALEKTEGVTVVYTKMARHAHIEKDHGARYQWNETAKMHLSCETAKEAQNEADDFTMKAIVDEAFTGRGTMRYSELRAEIIRIKDCADSTAEKFIKKIVPRFVRKTSSVYERVERKEMEVISAKEALETLRERSSAKEGA